MKRVLGRDCHKEMTPELVRFYFLLYQHRQSQRYIAHPGVRLLLTERGAVAIGFYCRRDWIADREGQYRQAPSNVWMNHPD